MTYAGAHCMDHEGQLLQRRLAAFLRRQYAAERESRLARDIDCDPRTAKNLLNETWPNARHWARIVRRFGQDVLDAVFAPEVDETVARLAEELRHLEEQLETKRAAARQAEGLMARLAKAPDRHEDRPAAELNGDLFD
jgi:uncharacterized small protein (DUF1192 family)